MRMRWVFAGIAALALALLTLNVPWPSPARWFSRDARAAVGAACDPGAKQANLNYTLKDKDGKSVNLADFKGKVILLDFWATWCGPCKIEIPGFVELQAKYGKDGLVVIGVSVDDPLDELKAYALEQKMNYTVLQGLGHEDMQEELGPIWGIPTTLVISRDGKVCKKHTGLSTKDAFEREIKPLL